MIPSNSQPQPRFSLGQVVATPGALAALEASNQLPLEFLHRHVTGDWGCVCKEDAEANEEAIRSGERLLSAYMLNSGVKVWIITEADRSSSTLLLPSEY